MILWQLCAGSAGGTVFIVRVRLGREIQFCSRFGNGGEITLPAVLPLQRPPDFGLHGVHRLVHRACSGLVKALMHHHGWTKGRALVWVQWFWDDIRVESCTSTAADCEQQKVGKKALRLEQTAAGAWVKRQGWDCIADYLDGDNLLQVPVQVGGVTMTWTACWRLWGEKFAVTCDLVWKKGRLDLRDMNVLKGALSEMGSAHKACGLVATLWPHLWVDHMWGIAREWGTLSAFSAFRGEGRHQSLKSEIRNQGLKGGNEKRGSRLRGAPRAVRKGWAEVLRNDNLDWGCMPGGSTSGSLLGPAKRHMGMPRSIGKE